MAVNRLMRATFVTYLKTKSILFLLLSFAFVFQCQASVVGFLASLAAMIMGWIPDGEFNWNHALLLCAASLVTASLASFVLGLLFKIYIYLFVYFLSVLFLYLFMLILVIS